MGFIEFLQQFCALPWKTLAWPEKHTMGMPWSHALWMARMVWIALSGWVSSCLTVADEVASSLRSGDIGPFHVGWFETLYYPFALTLVRLMNIAFYFTSRGSFLELFNCLQTNWVDASFRFCYIFELILFACFWNIPDFRDQFYAPYWQYLCSCLSLFALGIWLCLLWFTNDSDGNW